MILLGRIASSKKHKRDIIDDPFSDQNCSKTIIAIYPIEGSMPTALGTKPCK